MLQAGVSSVLSFENSPSSCDMTVGGFFSCFDKFATSALRFFGNQLGLAVHMFHLAL